MKALKKVALPLNCSHPVCRNAWPLTSITFFAFCTFNPLLIFSLWGEFLSFCCLNNFCLDGGGLRLLFLEVCLDCCKLPSWNCFCRSPQMRSVLFSSWGLWHLRFHVSVAHFSSMFSNVQRLYVFVFFPVFSFCNSFLLSYCCGQKWYWMSFLSS